MKRLLLLAPVLSVVMLLSGGCATAKEGGMAFYEGSWKEVLAKAKAEHKPIFLDIYASWCGPCKMLKRQTFPDKEAGDFFNPRFINTSFDGEVGDGVMLARKFQITGYPALFILDENGNALSTTMGYQSADDLVRFGKAAIKK